MPRHPMLYDEDHDGPRWTYGLSYRPLGTANVPVGWLIGSHRPHPAYPFGTVDYPRQLSHREQRAYQLELVYRPHEQAAAPGESPG